MAATLATTTQTLYLTIPLLNPKNLKAQKRLKYSYIVSTRAQYVYGGNACFVLAKKRLLSKFM